MCWKNEEYTKGEIRMKDAVKNIIRPVYHVVVPEKIRARRIARLNGEMDYEKWITMLESNESYDLEFEYNPKISILVPVYNVLDKHLIPCIESVINQVYENWELCIADDCSTWPSVRNTLDKYVSDERIKIVYRKENGHISRCTNSALELATGEFVAFMDCDDVLRPNALYEVVKKLNENRELDFIYSDEDKIDDDGLNRHMPHFKPDWSPDTLMSHMYTCHFGVYRRSIANEIGGLRAGYEGAQDYDFTLRFTEKTDKIEHIDKILYHWRERKESTALDPSAKPYIFEAAKKSKEDALARRGLKGKLEMVDIMYQYRVNYISQDNPLVSIIIPSKDNYIVLKRCIDTLYEKTRYRNFEVVLIDNGSNPRNKRKYQELAEKYNFKYIYEKMDFNFSRMCNIGAENAVGEYYLFLNDDIEIIDEEWLERMVGHAELKHVGAVGAKLLYPNSNKIQHVGVINITNGPAHAFGTMSDDNIYYFGRNRIDYNWLAVTAACLLVNADKFEEVGGFDEAMAVTYNDVEFCIRLVEHGYYNVVRNDVVLYHHESISRGNDLLSEEKYNRLIKEQNYMYGAHRKYDHIDPFYNSNLAMRAADFSYNYLKENNEPYVVKKCDTDFELCKKIINAIDRITIGEMCIIEGWAFYNKEPYNWPIKILLKSEEDSYLITTHKVRRPDLLVHFNRRNGVEVTGFICEFPRVKSGKYEIFVCSEDKMTKTKKYLEL